jgi:CRISPR-associated protein Csh2
LTKQVNTGEILFVKSAKVGIPNRNLNDDDARRLFGPEDGRISLSDVSIARDVRDYLLGRFPDGEPGHRNHVFTRKQYDDGGKTLLGLRSLAEKLRRQSGLSGSTREVVCRAAIDVRLFGIVYAVTGERFHLTGPVRFGWAHSLHPAVSVYTTGTSMVPAKDQRHGDASEGAQQGTSWTSSLVPFAVFAMPAVVNATIAQETGLDQEDLELLLEALWQGTAHRQGRGRGLQQPLFLLHIEYKDPFFRIGYLEEKICLEPGREEWLGGNPPTSLNDVKLDVTRLVECLGEYTQKIRRVRYWIRPDLQLVDQPPWEVQPLW